MAETLMAVIDAALRAQAQLSEEQRRLLSFLFLQGPQDLDALNDARLNLSQRIVDVLGRLGARGLVFAHRDTWTLPEPVRVLLDLGWRAWEYLPDVYRAGPGGVVTLSAPQQKLVAYLWSRGPVTGKSMETAAELRGIDLERELGPLGTRGLVLGDGLGRVDLAREMRDAMNVAATYEKRGFEAVGHD